MEGTKWVCCLLNGSNFPNFYLRLERFIFHDSYSHVWFFVFSFFRIPCQLHLWPTQISGGCFRRSLCSDGRLFYECSCGKNFGNLWSLKKTNTKLVFGIGIFIYHYSLSIHLPFDHHFFPFHILSYFPLVSKVMNTK